MIPSSQSQPLEWSMARRTIRDIDLNDSQMGENDPSHLWRLRRNLLDLLRTTVNDVGDEVLSAMIIEEFTLPDSPFSSFVSAYVESFRR